MVAGLGATTPEQVNLSNATPIPHGDYLLEPVAEYRIEARVLVRELYHWTSGADLSPMDLGLGWGPMSDSAVLDHLELANRGRFLSWRAEQLPLPHAAINRNASNTHIIPAEDWIEDDLRRLRPGQVVRLEGYLVNARRSDGWRWPTSTTRDDTGDGACELMLVQAVEAWTPSP